MEVAWVPHHYHATVVRHVEPLVRVDRPGVRGGKAPDEVRAGRSCRRPEPERPVHVHPGARRLRDRKSTRLNSSHGYISYAVFCLKKKKKITTHSSRLR